MPRTNISVDQAVFEDFALEAEKRNKTFYAFTNESLAAVAKISKEGGDPAELYKLWKSICILKQIDVITLPSDFIDEMIAKLYALDKPGLLKMFGNLGSEIAGILKIAAEDFDQLENLTNDFMMIIPLKQFKVTRIDPSKIEIGIIGAGRKIESTECSLEFLLAILRAYGYAPTKTEINIGTIKLWASKRISV